MKGFVQSHLKERNSRVIYDLFDNGGQYSKAEISRLTGISAPTVIKIVDSLIEKGILIDIGEGKSYVGRRPNLLEKNAKAYYAVGVDFQDGKVRVGLADLDGALLGYKMEELTLPIEPLLQETVTGLIETLIKEYAISKEKVLGVGLGMPGIVDTNRNIVKYAYNIGMDEETDCTAMLEEFSRLTGLPVFMENDINAAAVGEFKARKLDRANDLVYVSLGFGLGAGLVLSGKLRHGINNFAGEIAYTSFDEGFDTSGSSVGWFEEKISGDKLKRAIGGAGPDEGYIADVSQKVALMLANFSVFLDFDLIVLGGLLVKSFGEELLMQIKTNLKRMSKFHINCALALSRWPELSGSAAIVIERRLKDIL